MKRVSQIKKQILKVREVPFMENECATQDERAGKCNAITKKTGKPCRHKAMKGGEFCRRHRQGGGDPEDAGRLKRKVKRRRKSLRARVNVISHAPDLLELQTGVGALKALLEVHVAELDSARGTKNGDGAEEYCAALETHGKRIQSLTGDLFAVIDRLTKIKERERMVLTPEEAAALVARIKERVIQVVESAAPDEPREELARRLAEAFESIQIIEKDAG